MALDLNRVTSFMGKDRDVTNKLLIGGAVSLVPILNFATAGYALNMFANVRKGCDDSEVLPDWSHFGEHFVKGLLVFLISLCYLFVPLTLAGVAVIPTLLAMFAGREGGLGVATSISLLGLAMVLGLALSFLSFMGTALFAETGDFGAAFRFGEILRRIGAALGDYLLALVVLFVGSVAVSLAAGMVPFIGAALAIPLTFPIQLMFWHAMGQIARNQSPD